MALWISSTFVYIFQSTGVKINSDCGDGPIFPILDTIFAWGLRTSNKAMANSLSIPPWLSKWNEGFPANPTDWEWGGLGMDHFLAAREALPLWEGRQFHCHNLRTRLQVQGRFPRWGNPPVFWRKAESVIPGILKTVLDLNSTSCCFLFLSAKFLFEKLLNVSVLLIFSTWQNLLVNPLNGCWWSHRANSLTIQNENRDCMWLSYPTPQSHSKTLCFQRRFLKLRLSLMNVKSALGAINKVPD